LPPATQARGRNDLLLPPATQARGRND